MIEQLSDRASAPYHSEPLKRRACFIASAHPRAIDYLEQAPVLALVAPPPEDLMVFELDRELAAANIRLLCDRGARLRDVLARYGLPAVLRGLKGKALTIESMRPVRAIASAEPSAIAQAMPRTIRLQARWLAAVDEWSWQVAGFSDLIAWGVVQLGRHGVRARDVSTVIDFHWAARHQTGTGIHLRWTWPQAVASALAWHADLHRTSARTKFGDRLDARIDTGSHPDEADVSGFEFVALRTPAEIDAEGKAMGHCVASYVRRVEDGHSHIVSILQAGARVATLELSRSMRAEQIKGRFNAEPAPAVMRAALEYVRLIDKGSRRTSSIRAEPSQPLHGRTHKGRPA